MIILGYIRQKGADAAERARIVGDFIQRKQEAEANRRRGNAELFGVGGGFVFGYKDM